jgi:4-hydroxybenzoate polyprenyltransferase
VRDTAAVRIPALIQAAHPEPCVAVTAITTALAVSAGRGAGSAVVAAALLSGQLSIGWSNDWIDAARDRRTGRPDKPAARGDVTPAMLRTAALLAVLACVPLSLAMGTRAGLAHLAAVASAWAYNAGLKSTPLSWAPYAFSFGLIPSIVTLGGPSRSFAPLWATLAGALLGVGAHLANVLPDLADDLATGVRGLPHRLGAGATQVASAALLLAATGVLAVGPGRPGLAQGAACVAAAAVTAAGFALTRRTGSRAAFRAVLVVAGIDVALLLASGTSLT